MRRAFALLLGVLAVGAVVVQSTAAKDEGSPGKDVLEFDVMSPVVAPFTGAAHPIRGVNGGGVPWRIDRGRVVVERFEGARVPELALAAEVQDVGRFLGRELAV